MDAAERFRSRVRGCLLGGAVGDALGAPVEFMLNAAIQERFGPDGLTGYAPAYGRVGAITDDTQMTLYTAEGLMRGIVRQSLRGFCSMPSVVCHAYLRWLLTQGAANDAGLRIGTDGWLWGVAGLHSRRAPGMTCVSALAALQSFNAVRALNQSKGAGTIMRVAPVAMIAGDGGERSAESVFQLAVNVSWITHGHPSGYLAAAAFAVIVHALLWGHPLVTGIERARAFLRRDGESAETLGALDTAVGLAGEGLPPGVAIPRLGLGWVAEEALGIALYCALTTSDFASAVCMAVNHDGDSDTTGSLAGQLTGAALGEAVLPGEWLRELELRDEIEAIADDLGSIRSWSFDRDGDASGGRGRIWDRYPGW